MRRFKYKKVFTTITKYKDLQFLSIYHCLSTLVGLYLLLFILSLFILLLFPPFFPFFFYIHNFFPLYQGGGCNLSSAKGHSWLFLLWPTLRCESKNHNKWYTQRPKLWCNFSNNVHLQNIQMWPRVAQRKLAGRMLVSFFQILPFFPPRLPNALFTFKFFYIFLPSPSSAYFLPWNCPVLSLLYFVMFFLLLVSFFPSLL